MTKFKYLLMLLCLADGPAILDVYYNTYNQVQIIVCLLHIIYFSCIF